MGIARYKAIIEDFEVKRDAYIAAKRAMADRGIKVQEITVERGGKPNYNWVGIEKGIEIIAEALDADVETRTEIEDTVMPSGTIAEVVFTDGLAFFQVVNNR